MAAFFASCNDEETGKETKWFYAPEAGVSGTTVEVSCRTKFGDGVLSSAQAGFAYAPIRSDDTGSFTETTDVTVDGQVMSCRLTGLDAETSYLIYAYVDMGSGGRMQSKPVVVKTMNDTEGVRVELTKEFKDKLERRTGLPVYFWDERLTTVAADKAMMKAGIRRENRKDYVDMIAATLILQGYLDRRNNEKKKETE